MEGSNRRDRYLKTNEGCEIKEAKRGVIYIPPCCRGETLVLPSST